MLQFCLSLPDIQAYDNILLLLQDFLELALLHDLGRDFAAEITYRILTPKPCAAEMPENCRRGQDLRVTVTTSYLANLVFP